MKKSQFENKLSKTDNLKMFIHYNNIYIIIIIAVIILIFLGTITFLSINKTYDTDNFKDKDITKLDIPEYLMATSDSEISLINTYSKEKIENLSFKSNIIAASDEEKQYFIVYEYDTKSLYEVYTVKEKNDGNPILKKQLIEENIKENILSLAVSKYHYAYATKEKIYIKDYSSNAVVQEISLNDADYLKIYNGFLFASNKNDFAVYAISMSEPKIYKNYSDSTIHMNNENMIVSSNYGQENNFSLLLSINKFGEIEKVIKIDDNKLYMLHSYPDDKIFMVKGNENLVMLYGTLDKLKEELYSTPIYNGTLKNNVFYQNKNNNLLLFYNKQPYYNFNIDMNEFALLFDIYEISPRQWQIKNEFNNIEQTNVDEVNQ